MNYKNSVTGAIVSLACYKKLPPKKQQGYIQVMDTVSHTVNEYRDDFMLYLIPDSSNYAMMGGLTDSAGGTIEF